MDIVSVTDLTSTPLLVDCFCVITTPFSWVQWDKLEPFLGNPALPFCILENKNYF